MNNNEISYKILITEFVLSDLIQTFMTQHLPILFKE